MTTTNNHHVLSFKDALARGYQPGDYSYRKEDIPTGEYHVILDFMIWANKVEGVDLHCTIQQTGQRFRITVFRDQEEAYKLGTVEVPLLQPGSTLAVQIELNGREKPTLHQITPLSSPESA